MQTSAGFLLGGRLSYLQPTEGYRTGIEPVLLAASIPARPGQRVLEGGTGAGAGLICLGARVPLLRGTGVEIDTAMAELARQNAAANGLSGLEIVTGDVTALELTGFDHAFANPPWHDPRSTPSPVGRRRLAKQAGSGGIDTWMTALAKLVDEGTITMILPAFAVSRAAATAQRAGLSEAGITWLLPKQDRPAKLALLAARKARADAQPAVLRERTLVLHEQDGRYTAAIEAVLRDGAALPE